jgi:hypothetical protein
VREALQRKHPLDLRALLDDPQQLVEVLRLPSLHRQHRHPARRHSPCARVKARQHAPRLDHLAARQLAAVQHRRKCGELVVAAHLDRVVDRSRIVLLG